MLTNSTRETSLFLAGDADFIYVSAANAFDMIEKDPWLNQKEISFPLKTGLRVRCQPISFEYSLPIQYKKSSDGQQGFQKKALQICIQL